MAHLTERFQSALCYAFELHNSQIRKGTGVPYVSHLMGVAALVLEDGGDEDEAIAALLHDAVEDQGGRETLEEIRRRYGDRVAEIVWGCSDTDRLPKPPWRVRKEEYIAHLAQADPSILRVSLADKIHNARDVLLTYRRSGDALWQRFKGGRDGTLWYYRELVAIFRRLRPDEMVEELDRVVAELEKLAVKNP